MNEGNKLEKLANEVNTLTDQYKKERDRHKWTAVLLRITSVTLAATITILLGVKTQSGELEIIFKNISIILGALITVVSAYEAFFTPRALWVRETVAYTRLKDLQRDIKLQSDDSSSIPAVLSNELKKRLDDILQEDLKGWIKIRGIDE